MTDREIQPGDTVSPKPADDRFTRVEKVIRWVFWIGMAGATVWVFASLLIHK